MTVGLSSASFSLAAALDVADSSWMTGQGADDRRCLVLPPLLFSAVAAERRWDGGWTQAVYCVVCVRVQKAEWKKQERRGQKDANGHERKRLDRQSDQSETQTMPPGNPPI